MSAPSGRVAHLGRVAGGLACAGIALALGSRVGGMEDAWVFAAAFALFAIGTVFIGPFGVLMGFIAVLFTRPGDLVPALEGAPIAKGLAFAALALLMGGKLLRREIYWVRSHFNYAMAALLGAVVISVIDSVDPAISVGFFTNVFVKIAVLWFLMMETMVTRRRTVAFQVTIAIMTSLIAAYSIGARILEANLIEGTRSSFVGLLADPNDLALTLLMSVPFLAEAALSRRAGKWRALWLVLLALNLGGLLVTQSRGGLLGLGAAGFVFTRQRIRSTVLVLGMMGVALAGLILVSGITERATVTGYQGSVVDASARGRLDAWIAGGRMLAYNPMTGVGLDQVTDMYSYYAVNPIDWRPKTSHNAFVQAAAETGLLGITPLLALVAMAFWSTWRLLTEAPPDTTPTEAALLRSQLGTLAAVMVSACFLSVAWSWFFYIVIAQAATSHRVWLTMPEVLDATSEASPDAC